MRHLTVRQKVGFWYTAMLVVMAVSVFLILQFANTKQIETYAAQTLGNAVEDAAEQVEAGDEEVVIDQDMRDIDYATIMVFDKTGQKMLYGPVPDFDLPFENRKVQQVTGDSGRVWNVYDVFYQLDEEEAVWLRACITLDSFLAIEQHSTTLFLWMIIPIILLAAWGGHYITARAFRPMIQINNTARNIADGSDLTRRIGLSERKDEFGQLSDTFDGMFGRLQDSFEREKQFTSDASHELRTPLSVIRSQCDFALSHPDEAEYEKALQVIQKQAERMNGLVNQLLFLSRADKGTQVLRPEEMDISLLMESVAQEIEEKAVKAGISVQTQIEPGIIIKADELLLVRMLMNLAENAVKFGRRGGYVRFTLCRDGDQVAGTVEDDGIGIGLEDQQRVWERFYQVDSSRSANSAESSSGLGLPMVQWIMKAHGGEIHLKSELGKGSVFFFTLPLAGRQK